MLFVIYLCWVLSAERRLFIFAVVILYLLTGASGALYKVKGLARKF